MLAKLAAGAAAGPVAISRRAPSARGRLATAENREALSLNRWEPRSHHLNATALWSVVRQEAKEIAAQEASLASLLHASVIMHPSIDRSVAFILASKLANRTLLATQLTDLIMGAYQVRTTCLQLPACLRVKPV